MAITRYNANDFVVLVDDVTITGLGEDMVSWEKEEAYFEPIVGAQGDVIKSEINNSIHNLTLAVQPTSPQLAKLISLLDQKETFSVWVTSKALGIQIGGTAANIKEAPEFPFSAEASDLEFTFCVFDGTTRTVS